MLHANDLVVLKHIYNTFKRRNDKGEIMEKPGTWLQMSNLFHVAQLTSCCQRLPGEALSKDQITQKNRGNDVARPYPKGFTLLQNHFETSKCQQRCKHASNDLFQPPTRVAAPARNHICQAAK